MEPARFCPMCELVTEELTCPTDRVPTLARQSVSSGEIPAGALIGGGRYRIERALGQGGMGAIYVATQLAVDRRVALKLLKKDLASDPAIIKRFYREAKAASSLDHPNIVRVIDFGVDEALGAAFIAMDLVLGQTLKRLVDAGPLEERRAAHLLSQVARALVAAHKAGVVHRDLKPENVIVETLADGEEHAVVLDFGIAKIIESEGRQVSNLTGAGAAIGTPSYMSPEQASGEPVDFRSDLYSLGCILHHLLTGAPPFQADQPVAILIQHVQRPPPPLPARLAGGPPSPGMVELHRALLAKDKRQRGETTMVVARVLSALARGVSIDVAAALHEPLLDSGEGTPPSGVPFAGPPGLDTAPLDATTHPSTPALSHQTLPLPKDAPPPPARRAWVGVVGLAAVMGVLLAAALTSGTASVEPMAVVVPAAVVAPAEAPAAPAPAPELPPPAKIEVRLTLVSDPDRASVFRDGHLVGVTPVTLTLPPSGEPARLLFRKDGFLDREEVVVPDESQRISVTLGRPPAKPTKKGKLDKPAEEVPVW